MTLSLSSCLRSGLVGVLLAAAPVPARAQENFQTTVRSAILFDVGTESVLFEKAADEPQQPASLAKLMTMAVIFEEMRQGRLLPDQEIVISQDAWRRGGAPSRTSSMYAAVNSRVKVQDLLRGAIVQSGNDAAIALAEHAAGSQEAFAALMNNYAAQIGMKGSHFANAHGLSAPEHYSTAYDLALLGRALIREYPAQYAFNKIKEFTVGAITQPNRNLLLWRDPSVDGIKTGHHSAAGYCLMSSAKRGDQRLIAVVMGSTSEKQRADDSLALLNWGFRFYETHRLYEPGKAIATQRVWKGKTKDVQLGVAQPMLVSVPRGRYDDLKPTMDVPKTLVAPITAGQAIGTVKVTLDGKVVAQSPLVAITAIEEAGFFKRLWDAFWMWWESE
jgi:D-alanyl-D-alanine carboxypeptidase (penicillin-binding protein 5/6)